VLSEGSLSPGLVMRGYVTQICISLLIIIKHSTELTASLIPVQIQAANLQNEPQLSKCTVLTISAININSILHVSLLYYITETKMYLFIYLLVTKLCSVTNHKRDMRD
jgi:hypothetical protein